jgi:anti-sigma factor RsiW
MDELMELLHRSFDGGLSPAERERLDEALGRLTWLAAEQRTLEALHRGVAGARADSFGPGFSLGVMEALRRKERLQGLLERNFQALRSAFYRVRLAGAAACLLFAVWNGARAPRDEDAVPRLELEEALEVSVYSSLEESL